MTKLAKRTAEYMGLEEYLRSEKQSRAGFTTTDGAGIIAEELLQPAEQLSNRVDLTKYVTEIPVNRASGKYQFVKGTDSKLVSVAELEANPELPQPEVIPISYSIATYRGALPIAQEVVDDADYDVVEVVVTNAKQADVNTKNDKIEALYKTATAKAVTGLDGLTTLVNGFKSAYDVKLFLSSSLFDALDKMKDTTGKYHVFNHESSFPSGVSFKGHEVVKIDDTEIGTLAGDLVGFVGDSKQFIALFNRKLVTVKWNGSKDFTTPLLCASRFDTKVADTEAGYYITYTA